MTEVFQQDDASRSTDRVIVVGAGLSGCACAAKLGRAGVPVLLINSALDVVGLPGYGPVVDWPGDPRARGSQPPLDVVEPDLARLWSRWASISVGSDPPRAELQGGRGPASRAGRPGHDDGGDDVRGGGLMVVDRRALSLELKQLLESMPVVHLRQGSVVSVRSVQGVRRGEAPVSTGGARHTGTAPAAGPIEVETAFGEVFRGAACVLAVGLGLGGRVIVGDQVLEGARYGEVAADPLLSALESLGVGTREVVVEVGAWVSTRREGGSPSFDHPLGRHGVAKALRGRLRPLSLCPLVVERDPGDGSPLGPQHLRAEQGWSAEYGDASRGDGLGPVAWVAEPSGGSSPGGYEGAFPDGTATGELYVTPGSWAGDGPWGGGNVTRRDHVVRGRVLEGLDGDGGLPGICGVWAAGQVAGARGYIESLVSGSRVAVAVASWLCGKPALRECDAVSGRGTEAGPGRVIEP